MIFEQKLPALDPLRLAVCKAYWMDETQCVESLLAAAALPDDSLAKITDMARELVLGVRKERMAGKGLDAFLRQYDLSSEEGVALMCLAEAMLRVPDKETIDALIRDKVTTANWQDHLGKSPSLFVNAATWGLMLTGKVLSVEQTHPKRLRNSFKRLVEKLGEPVIRKAAAEAMKILGRQFVMGNTIEEAMKRARSKEEMGYRYSYDMLGEAACTAEDAERYFKAYQNAVTTIGQQARGVTMIERPGISIKLSALYPRYELAQQQRALPVLVDRLRSLALQAKGVNIGLTVDAEEARRLDISVDIMEAVFSDPQLEGWEGFGFALQAYQKRALPLLDYWIAVAQRHKRRLCVRLVKGAYWDSEIKEAQIRGLLGYPVFTRKASTDVSYIACAKKMIEAGDAIYPQFATHNARSVATILTLMAEAGRTDFEFQCLHGMGRPLYDQIVDKKGRALPCRIYAPVGTYQDLLPYLVRRLLENGANSSFVNRIIDSSMAVDDIITDPVALVAQLASKPHSRIPLPRNLYKEQPTAVFSEYPILAAREHTDSSTLEPIMQEQPTRANSQGIDLTDYPTLMELVKQTTEATQEEWTAMPLLGDREFLPPLRGEAPKAEKGYQPVLDPSNSKRQVGWVRESTEQDVSQAIGYAVAAAPAWDATPVEKRAAYLEQVADLFEAEQAKLIALLVREAGKTLPDAVSELREAVDFCRYYASEARRVLQVQDLPGPTGETNQLHLHGRGVVLCISPWNFPLAIFVGQISAALVTGNAVLAKPARQTSLIAAMAIRLFRQAGIPAAVVQLLPGRSEVVGAPLIADERINGVLLTGSTETARKINQSLAARPGSIVPFIAETGGQNAMIVDSTALPEQVVNDVISSAFGSAGQRCSALRVLFLQEEVADKIITMLAGAMAELQLGDPGLLATDIGPVIDETSRAVLEAHAEKMAKIGKLIYRVELGSDLKKQGSFFPPQAYEIDGLHQLTQEVFGPILHVIRYPRNGLDAVLAAINSTGFGLTFGLHTRINETADYICQRVNAGNIYINRNMIGAVVGVQPFGGEGLSGTGPKAGGPHYLLRLCKERTVTINTTAMGGNASLMALGG